MLLVGVALLTTGINDIPRGGGFGMVLAGAIQFLGAMTMITFGRRFLKRAQQQPVESRLTMEGQMLVINLANHVGWSVWQGPQAPHALAGPHLAHLAGSRTASQVLPSDFFEVLETLAHGINRVSGLLDMHASTPSIRDRVPLIRAALDEAIITSFNDAAMGMTRPEGKQAAMASIQRRSAEVADVANHLESMLGAPGSMIERLESASLITNVVEQLRMDVAARLELHSERSSSED